ncbi:hypothetical protein [Streptomyces goshikiensis]|uniref:hypothetical protein n=1 Tax=Streptomyces goshikiensis TaxID=1942 RepID=UPI003662FD7E
MLSLSDRIRYDGREDTVFAPHGTSVRLVDDAHAASVVLLGHLVSSDGFAVVRAGSVRPVMGDPGALKGLPEDVTDRVRW